ncbi:hypothetical protein [Seleniivibrio woodruffii]|uniref:hypothetical protein n=1 Tax=Seleniivibrio woodruffii TaxID=1078050 RepID=UPI002409A6E6|nr:hypothetical protein [Seleniivibrio woodruffii]
MKKVLVLVSMLFCATAFAGDFQLMPTLTQSQFSSLIKDIGLAVTPTPNGPAETLGVLGFDVAVETQLTTIDNKSDKWENSWDNADPNNTIWANRVHVQKGLPFGFDIGASITKGANMDFTAYTIEGKYAILEGSVLTPAISAKLAYTKVTGLEDVNLQTGLAGLYISKGFLILTPYAGIEDVYTIASEDGDLSLDDESANAIRGMVGLQVCPFPFVVLNIEAARGGAVNQFGLKAAIRF